MEPGNIISATEAHDLRERLRRAMVDVGQLRDRLTAGGVPPGEPLAYDAGRAYAGLHALCVHLHYLTCDSGVARP